MADVEQNIVTKEEELLQLHKKERKDLQAKIQNLKKTSCKGDKKSKKKITEEIAKLESDLDKKQEEELASLKVKLSNLSVDCPDDKKTNNAGRISNTSNGVIHQSNNKEKSNNKPNKVSRAQKRRDKKENYEKERNQRIMEEEESNLTGKRNVEIQAINVILNKRNLKIYEIPSDGHCLYNAIAHQLKLIGEKPELDLYDLRKKTANHLRENTTYFLPFIHNPESDELLTLQEYEKYCNDVADSSAWGGAVELQVLSQILKCPIEVVQADGVPCIVGNEFKMDRKLILSYHRHMYHLGEHYNSVVSKNRDVDNS